MQRCVQSFFKLKNLGNLRTDLQTVFGMLQYRGNTEKLKSYVEEHKDYFSSVDKDTYNAIAELLQSKSKLKNVLKPVKAKNGEERVNVCKAIDGIYENGVNAGKKMMLDKVKEAEKKAQEEKQKVLEDVAVRMLETMDKAKIAEILGIELDILN